jgi:excisionase family DNA binding protein
METTTIGGVMPLVEAAFEGDMVRVQALIEEGADVNERDASGRTALMIAANRGHTYVVQLLLERGADANARDNQGLTALEAAESRGFQRIVSLLSKFIAYPAQQEAGSNWQSNASASRLSLHRAVDEGDFSALLSLIETGADVNARSNDEWTPLMLATIKGHTSMIEALLKNGADVNARNKKGWTALMFAVSMSDIEAMRILLMHGANINARDREGKTALMQAACENNRESLKFLLEVGADVRLKDLSGETALDLARKRKFDEVAKMLKRCEDESGPSVSSDNTPPVLSSAGVVNDIFNESELERLKKELAPFMVAPVPQGGALVVQPVEAVDDASANAQALVPAHLSDMGERLIAALQALLQVRRQETEQPSVADIAQKLILTLAEASALSNLSRPHLRQAMRDGRLKGKIIGRGWRIKRTDLDHYVRTL